MPVLVVYCLKWSKQTFQALAWVIQTDCEDRAASGPVLGIRLESDWWSLSVGHSLTADSEAPAQPSFSHFHRKFYFTFCN